MRKIKRRISKRRDSRKRKNFKERFFTKQDIFASRMASILMVPTKSIIPMFSQRILSIIRLNNLADEPSKILHLLRSKGLELDKVGWSPDTYIVLNSDKSDLGEMHEYKRGLFYIQNLSSMLPVVELGPQQGEKILDMCAAPGSKTTMICSMVNDNAEIVANEEDFRRLSKLQNVLRQFHCKNVGISQNDGSLIGKVTPDHYNKVLLDAPCSGEGLIYLKGENPLRFWSIKKVKVMRRIQEELILSAFDSLKKGGTLIYSTCTLEPEENEVVVSFLLNMRSNSKVLPIETVATEAFSDYKKITTPGITKWSGNSYSSDLKLAVRILPSELMQGFFVAKITKV